MPLRRIVSSSVAALLNRENAIEMREYDCFESALLDSDSYEDPRLIEVVKEKTKRYRDRLENSSIRAIENRQMAQNMFVLSYVEPQRPINVLEIGGACGASYFEARVMLPNRIRRWSIVETPAMAAAGRSLTTDTSLAFHSDAASAVQELETRDLAIAQGALQYAGNPLRLLTSLFEFEMSHVYITRTAVTNMDTPIFTRQVTRISEHGPGKMPDAPNVDSSQPMTLVSAPALFGAIPSHYEIVFRFDESQDRTLSIGGRSVGVRDIGFLARRRASNVPGARK